jgi:zinc/manganese transport system substrate-binding protein
MHHFMRFVVIALLAVACLTPAAAFAKIRVVTTTTDLADLASNVGGDLVTVESIAKGYQDPHQVDARPSYILLLRKANLFVQMGLDLESAWAPALLQGARNSNIMPGAAGFVDASRGIAVIRDPGAMDRTAGDVHPLGNPHYHLDPANAKVMARNIADGLKRVDPANAQRYEANLAAFVKRLSETSRRWAEIARTIKGAKVVTYHNSWPYFARRFGLNVVEHVEPKAGIAPSAAHLARLVKLMKAQGVKVILIEPYFSPRLAETVARNTGARVVILSPSVGGEASVKSYLDLFTYQLEKIAQALKG